MNENIVNADGNLPSSAFFFKKNLNKKDLTIIYLEWENRAPIKDKYSGRVKNFVKKSYQTAGFLVAENFKEYIISQTYNAIDGLFGQTLRINKNYVLQNTVKKFKI